MHHIQTTRPTRTYYILYVKLNWLYWTLIHCIHSNMCSVYRKGGCNTRWTNSEHHIKCRLVSGLPSHRTLPLWELLVLPVDIIHSILLFQTVIKAHCGCSAVRIKRSQSGLCNPHLHHWILSQVLSLCWVTHPEALLQLEHPAASGLLLSSLCVQMKRGHYVRLFHYHKIKGTSLNRMERSSPTYPCLSLLSGNFTSGEESLEPASEDRKCLQRSESSNMTTGEASHRMENISYNCLLLLHASTKSTLNMQYIILSLAIIPNSCMRLSLDAKLRCSHRG